MSIWQKGLRGNKPFEQEVTLVFVCVAACVLGEGLRGSKSFERGITLTYIFDAACVPGERLRGPQQLPGE